MAIHDASRTVTERRMVWRLQRRFNDDVMTLQ